MANKIKSNKLKGDKLIKSLFENPDEFDELERGYDLLQIYFGGYPMNTLIPALESNNTKILRNAASIVSELGTVGATYLLEYVIPLTSHEEFYVRYHAMECILLGTINDNHEKFVYLIKGLEDKVSFMRGLLIRLISRSKDKQIEACIKSIKQQHDNELLMFHLQGLHAVLNVNELTDAMVIDMFGDKKDIVRRYAAVIALRKYWQNKQNTYLINHASKMPDEDVSRSVYIETTPRFFKN